MDTTTATQVAPRTRGLSRRAVAAIVGLFLVAAIAIAVGIGASRASTPATRPPVMVSVAPGHHQPATEIYRLSMRPLPNHG
jgi:hypothetical protein